MNTVAQITEKEVGELEFPFDNISWDYNGDVAFYHNNEHTIDTDEYMLVFHLRVSGREGDERNEAWIGEVHQVWIGDEIVKLTDGEESKLRKRLREHYMNPNNTN